MTYINKNAYDVRGIDVLVSHKNHFMLGGKPFQYGISATLTYAKNRWIIYPDEPNVDAIRKVVGTSLDAFSTPQRRKSTTLRGMVTTDQISETSSMSILMVTV